MGAYYVARAPVRLPVYRRSTTEGPSSERPAFDRHWRPKYLAKHAGTNRFLPSSENLTSEGSGAQATPSARIRMYNNNL